MLTVINYSSLLLYAIYGMTHCDANFLPMFNAIANCQMIIVVQCLTDVFSFSGVSFGYEHVFCNFCANADGTFLTSVSNLVG